MKERPTNDKMRGGLCDPESRYEYTNHLAIMNQQAQWVLKNIRPDANLPYYDTVAYDDNGDLIMPPSDVRCPTVQSS
ncbi:hypothetical protein N7471_002425 [Penicillium samsonianum]|uniref:uncharacterized protein n=1 Tax=Penicillium samsonianum TaxID=1882272 RepID=UPI0025497C02|nr:uncharacterized protein N7471_002425 [Penicillium samsonianum]KAJ6142972.1 hypothetical protein N7471_002425 [Penicillium samsonianum]